MLHWSYLGGPGFLAGGGWFIAFAVGRVLILALIAFAIVKWVKRRENHKSHAGAIQILDGRYARGEIDETEYVQRKDVLKK